MKKLLNQFTLELIKELKEENRYGTAHIYQSSLNAFIDFCGKSGIPFELLNRGKIKEFENHLRHKMLSWNTVSTYMRTLRSIYNKAVDCNLVPESPRLFRHVYTGVKADTKRALEANEMNKLLNYSPSRPLSKGLERSRIWITLMFQLRGMPFVDLAHLHKNDLQGSVISYRRRKTGTLLTVDLLPATRRLIEKYKDTNPASPYLLPILSGTTTGAKNYSEYQQALRVLNYDLKKLAMACGIKKPVSSYTTRHSWATLAKYCHIPEELICDALGHSSIKVTETYLRSFKGEELNNANRTINQYISNCNNKINQSETPL
ncbi:tyrosine-type recombinase/integrase [Phocaeicola sp.]